MENWIKSLIGGSLLAILGWLAVSYLGVLNYIATNDEFHNRVVEYIQLDRAKVESNRDAYETRCDEMDRRVSRIEEWILNHEKHQSYRDSLQRN